MAIEGFGASPARLEENPFPGEFTLSAAQRKGLPSVALAKGGELLS
jgi:hypothetical protein